MMNVIEVKERDLAGQKICYEHFINVKDPVLKMPVECVEAGVRQLGADKFFAFVAAKFLELINQQVTQKILNFFNELYNAMLYIQYLQKLPTLN